jgi:hypothetical protein
MNSEETHHVKFLADLWNIPLARITWYSDGMNSRIWSFHLENGLIAMVTSAELLNQRKFQTKLLGLGVLPLDVRPAALWKEMVVPSIIQVAEPWEKEMGDMG